MKTAQKLDFVGLEQNRSYRLFVKAIKNEHTLKTYKYHLKNFLRYTNLPSYDAIIQIGTDRIQELLENLVFELEDKGRKGTAIKTSLAGVELFLEMNRVIYHKKILHKLVTKDTQEPGGSDPITTDDIVRMLSSTRKPRLKAIIHFIASTGIRPNAIVDPVLKRKHLVKMPHDCYAIKVYDNSTEGYWAFLTPEASKALDEYHKQRKFNGEDMTDETPLFVNDLTQHRKNGIKFLTSNHLKSIMHNLMKTASISRIKTGHRYNIAASYGFRKRFNTILKINNNVNSNIAEKLLAHKNGLDGVYFKPTREECFEEFKKAILDLAVDSNERLSMENKIKDQTI
ncbi:MAG: tyrosine-type recombinase/integrase, partial [Nitrosotalea sp.]